MMDDPTSDIKYALERLYERYNHRELVPPDPLQLVYHYTKPADMEIVAFLASALAYGRVQQIERSLDSLFGRMGDSPFEFVIGFDRSKRQTLSDFKHRFTSGEDVSDLLAVMKTVLERYGSLEKCFVSGYNPADRNILPALSKFCGRLLSIHAAGHKGPISLGLRFLLAGPAGASACKRLNLFLRWMIRNDDVDTGLWRSVEPAKLLVPVDVHIGRLCKILGLYNRKTISLSTAVEITESFTRIEPADPVRYDFALSRIGIVENCSGGLRPACERCELSEFCRYRIVELRPSRKQDNRTKRWGVHEPQRKNQSVVSLHG